MRAAFDHIALTTVDIQESIDFYRDRFEGVEVVHQDNSWGFLKVGALKLALVTESEHPPHICFRVTLRAELEQYAQNYGGQIVVHRDRSESFYVFDPSANVIEILWYPEDY